MKHSTVRLSVLCLCGLASLLAQGPGGGGSRGSTSGPIANQLPLSGETGQTGAVSAVQSAIPGTTTSVNTLNTTIQVQGPYAGSSETSPLEPREVTLTLRDAIKLGLAANLGPEQLSNALRQARGQTQVARSGLLPNISSELQETVQKNSLVAFGLRLPGIPSVVGPFNYFDLRARLSQTIFDWTTLKNYRASQDLERASEALLADARDMVVFAVTGTYLQTQAAASRVEAARSQVQTAEALLKQTQDRNEVGLSPRIDVNRSRVQMQTQRQRLTSLDNDLAKQKISLARMIGLPPGQPFELTTEVPFSPAPDINVESGLHTAIGARADLLAAQIQVQAAEKVLSAARAERYPTLAFNADYGAIGIHPSRANGTFLVSGSLRIPIWQGGRVAGDIAQASAALIQRRAELEDTRQRIEAEIRNALLDLEASGTQVKVALENSDVTRDTLKLARERFDAGIADAVELTQAQEQVAVADQDYITSLSAWNIAKVALARALGRAEENIAQFLGIP